MAKLIRALELHYPVIQFVIPCYSFIIGAMFFGYSNLLLVHLRLEHRGNLFTVTMVEPIALQGWCCFQAKIKGQSFQGNHQNTHKKITSLHWWYLKAYSKNKSLCFFLSRAPLVLLKVVYRGSVTKPCTPTLRGQGDTKVSQQFRLRL